MLVDVLFARTMRSENLFVDFFESCGLIVEIELLLDPATAGTAEPFPQRLILQKDQYVFA